MAEPVKKTEEFALCDECAVLFTAAFALKKLAGTPGQMVTCSNCRKKKPGAEYVEESL